MSIADRNSVVTFLYFRIVVTAAMKGPVGAAGLIAFTAHPGSTTAVVLVAALVTNYAVSNAMLFRQASRDKLAVLRFLERYEGASFERVPARQLAHLFDFSFMIPSYVRPRWLIDYFVDHRLHVFLVRRGTAARIFASPSAFVSPIAQDAYIFLREDIGEMSSRTRFRLTHELGHAAAIYATNAQRNLIGLVPMYLSMAWTVAGAAWTPLLLGWTLAQLLATMLVGGAMFELYRGRQRFNGEIVADYMAVRHLPDGIVADLVAKGSAETLVGQDPTLSDVESAQRRRILAAALEARNRGEEIEIPEIYLRETFRHPALFSGLLLAHLAYLANFAITDPPAPLAALLFCLPALVIVLLAALVDGALRHSILTRISPRPFAKTGSDAAESHSA